ncbi:tetratricopeptide repeat protein [Caballeronia sp. GAWG1-1]|uniref:tetratricopeptide repeat protein n=1 Tax=Caballeronia sp. GAWG1-1 TaxID=2921742 RepID=UPI0032EBA5D8
MSAKSDSYGAAAAFYASERFVEALEALSYQINQPYADTEALNLAAVCCYRLNRLDEAESHWRRAVAQDPQYAGGYANLGNLLMLRGRLDDAETVYREAIAIRPDFAEAHYNLGNLLVKKGRLVEAEAALRQACAAHADFADAHFNLANLLKSQSRLAEAEIAFQRAIAARGNYADAFNNLGNLLRESGRLVEAEAALRQAVACRPDFAEANFNLAQVLNDLKDFAQAEAFYRRAVELRRDYMEAHVGLGAVLHKLQRVQEAQAVFLAALSICPDDTNALMGLANAYHALDSLEDAERIYRRVLILEPDNVQARTTLGYTLQKLERLCDAEAEYREALILAPDAADIHYNLGILYGHQDRLNDAERTYRRAIECCSDHVEAHNNLGRILQSLGRLETAESILRRSIAIQDDIPEAHNNLAGVLKDMGAMEEAIQSFRRAVDCGPNDECVHRNLNYALTYHAETPREILEECLRFAARHEAPLLRHDIVHTNNRDSERRLKIGYVAPDFDGHCQAMFTAPVFAQHDHAAYQIYCYSSVKTPDAITHLIRPMADTWRDVHALDDEQLAQLVRDDGIDVLVDLTMHMSRGRPLLFARRPAPVQVQWLAYPGTTGSSAIRYRLTDPWIDPRDTADLADRYSEETVWLPETFWCFDPRVTSPNAPDVNALPAWRNGHITFGCLNNPCKASERTLRMWAAILAAVPNARFILLAGPGPRERFSERLGALGVDLSRVRYVGYQSRVDYLRTYQTIDIGLDTYPYNGHTTSLDALWMGVPVPSRAGDTSVSRAGLSLLMNLGIGELVVHDDAAYVDVVTRLANDLPRLTELRSTLRARLERSPMMDAPRFTRNLEAAYRQMWRAWCASPGA